jgi:hypothetical protein
MSDSSDDLDTDYLDRRLPSKTKKAAESNADHASFSALLAKREAHRSDLARVASLAAPPPPAGVAATSSPGMALDSLQPLQARPASAYAAVRLLSAPSVHALAYVAPASVELLGHMTRSGAAARDGDESKRVRLQCDALEVPSAAKDAELLCSGALLHVLPRDGSCSPALLNFLLWRVVHARDDLLTTSRAAEYAVSFIASGKAAQWVPDARDLLQMCAALGVRAVRAVEPAPTVLRVDECVLGAADAHLALPAVSTLPLDNVRLVADVIGSCAPHLARAADSGSALLLVRALLTLVADARIERAHRACLLALDALFDAHADGGEREHALALEVAACSDDAALLYAVLRRLPLSSARVRRVSGRAALIAVTALSGGTSRLCAERLARAGTAVRAALTGGAGAMARAAVGALETCVAVPSLRVETASAERVNDCNWLMACAFLSDLAVACDAQALHSADDALRELARLMLKCSTKLPEEVYSPLISLAKTRLGALRAKATMLANACAKEKDDHRPTLVDYFQGNR